MLDPYTLSRITKRINEHVKNSLMLVTALNKYIGYDNATKISNKAFKDNITLREAADKLGIISLKKFDKIVKPEKMV